VLLVTSLITFIAWYILANWTNISVRKGNQTRSVTVHGMWWRLQTESQTWSTCFSGLWFVLQLFSTAEETEALTQLQCL